MSVCLSVCLSYARNSEKELKLLESDSLNFGWRGLIESSSGIRLYEAPACNKCHIRALCPFLDFLAEIFWGSQTANRGSWLAARGSGSQARKIASPVAPR